MSEWIDWKVKAPPIFAQCLGWNARGNMAHKAGSYRIFTAAIENTCDISHWVPLPPPPFTSCDFERVRFEEFCERMKWSINKYNESDQDLGSGYVNPAVQASWEAWNYRASIGGTPFDDQDIASYAAESFQEKATKG